MLCTETSSVMWLPSHPLLLLDVHYNFTRHFSMFFLGKNREMCVISVVMITFSHFALITNDDFIYMHAIFPSPTFSVFFILLEKKAFGFCVARRLCQVSEPRTSSEDNNISSLPH